MIHRTFRVDPHRALRRALADLLGGKVSGIEDEPWSSATIDGRRHRLRVVHPDHPDRSHDLAAVEFVLPGHIVADIAVAERHRRGDGIELIVEALTVVAD